MNAEKPEYMRIAKQFGEDYWDGDREYGYGGYQYDGRWVSVAESIRDHYDLIGRTALDIGCGKGFLAHDLTNLSVYTEGVDISKYAIENRKLDKILRYEAQSRLPFFDRQFDLVYSINVFHNLNYRDLKQAIREMVRVSKEKMYICVESYRNEEELCNLQCWALTCQSFYSPDDWLQIYEDCGYKGDYEFITFA
jgi:ubiquinone/menaquinone biosynthesis C-methylase UbiE